MKSLLKYKKLMGLSLLLSTFSSAQAALIAVQAESGTLAAGGWDTITQTTIDGANAPLNSETLGGGSAIMANANNFSSDPSPARVDYSVTISTAADYSLWVRYIIPDLETFAGSTQVGDSNNSFYATLFDADSTLQASYSSKSLGANYDEALYFQLAGPTTLAAGSHTFAVSPRENGMILDGFVITDEAFNETAFDSALAVVPEPSSIMLLGVMGVLGLFVRSRR